MSSLLETVPYDVLTQVAFHTAAGSIFGPPSSLPSLLLTSRTLYRELNPKACPQLYARLFDRQFDSPTLFTWDSCPATSTTLSDEYIARQRLLRRSRMATWSDESLLRDMRCALRMVIESDGTNEVSLAVDRFPEQLLCLAETYLSDNGENDSRELKCLIIWLLSLTISRGDITKISPERQGSLCFLLKPFTVEAASVDVQTVWFSELATFYRDSIAPSRPSNLGQVNELPSILFGSPLHLSVLQPCFPAITVICALKEATPILAPPTLPETRAIAVANQLTGPTQEDLHEFNNRLTPLFADPVPREHSSTSFTLPGRCRSHDPEFYGLFGLEDENVTGGSRTYRSADTFSGLWKGCWLLESNDEGIDFELRRPMEVSIRSYHCFSAVSDVPQLLSEDPLDMTVFPYHVSSESHDDFERLLEQHHYFEESESVGESEQLQRVEETSEGGSDPQDSRGNSRHIVDTILFGETTNDHDQAWQGYRYTGRAHADGLVILKREPKNRAEEYLGIAVFQGRLRFGGSLVGSWRGSTAQQQGIFTLVKASRT
ncbi:hypothetical protein FA15DRAFT_664445 [Coprinopsis marcescibilis]|uniref:F-box domain-containing protein n=1 Tax=Coprinopsis marcescibilis TaxID=230819 RepID=A0A5C3L8N9_COPMA|nr:hypothetical protein FA15DRAFT_664445 [Coprinopsis marcescibilis]